MMKLKPMADGQWGVFEDDVLVALSFNWFVAILKCAAWHHGSLETRMRMQRELAEQQR
jgi:hypothetical protein